MYTYVHVFTCIYIGIYMYIHILIYIYIYLYIYIPVCVLYTIEHATCTSAENIADVCPRLRHRPAISSQCSAKIKPSRAQSSHMEMVRQQMRVRLSCIPPPAPPAPPATPASPVPLPRPPSAVLSTTPHASPRCAPSAGMANTRLPSSLPCTTLHSPW